MCHRGIIYKAEKKAIIKNILRRLHRSPKYGHLVLILVLFFKAICLIHYFMEFLHFCESLFLCWVEKDKHATEFRLNMQHESCCLVLTDLSNNKCLLISSQMLDIFIFRPDFHFFQSTSWRAKSYVKQSH